MSEAALSRMMEKMWLETRDDPKILIIEFTLTPRSARAILPTYGTRQSTSPGPGTALPTEPDRGGFMRQLRQGTAGRSALRT